MTQGKRQRRGRVALAVVALSMFGNAALAASGSWVAENAARARLITTVEATGAREVIPAGLHIELADGWKTYWRSPGDAGMPPTVDWSASENVAGVDWHWPAPHRFTLFGLETFGYSHEVVFPLDIRVERPGEPLVLRGRADVLVCSEVCVPTTFDLALDLPAGPSGIDPEAANRIGRFEAQVPGDGISSGLSVRSVAVERGEEPKLVIEVASTAPLDQPDVFVETENWTFGKPAFSYADAGRAAIARLPVVSGPDIVTMPGTPVTVTLVDGSRAAEARLAVGAAILEPASAILDLLPILGIALLGGLVLNVMPCVLPVLSLKLLSVLDRRGKARRHIRLGFLATAAGIVTSMLVIAGVLIGLRAAGTTVGWGMQFQQPVFLILMSAILVLFAANLAGGFEVQLPTRVTDALGRAGGEGIGGNFVLGAFATLLATPCSAPFLGTAVGFALARGPLEILATFGALGIGLALPYLLVAAFPSLTAWLPRPGRWMRALRLVLAIALAGTAVWLLSVLAVQTTGQAAIVVGATLVLLAATVSAASRVTRLARLGVMAVAVAALTGAFAAPAFFEAAAARPKTPSALNWVAFDEASISGLIAQGRTVFVDVTADWCITCIANKTLVLEQGDVASALTSGGVIAMQADWTKPDQRIAAFLARYDRYGIPFNVVYGPGAPRGIVLPEVLNEEAVLTAIGQASAAGSKPMAGQAGVLPTTLEGRR